MHFYKFLNIILFFFLLEIIIHSSADDWKKLKKKLIALSILNGLRVKKSYVVPLPMPLPMPVLIKKVAAPVILPPKRYPVFIPKPMPVYHLVPKFVPVHHKEKVIVVQEPQDIKYTQQNHRNENTGWDQDWPQDSYASNSHVSQDYMNLGNDGNHDLAMSSFTHENRYEFPSYDGYQDYQDQSSHHYMFPEEGLKRRKNKHRFQKQDFRSFQDIGISDYHNNEDLLMSSTESKTRKTESVRNGKPGDNYRDFSAHKEGNTSSGPKKYIDSLPVSEDEIKHILTDLKSINEDVKALPRGHISGPTDSGTESATKKVKVGEIRLKPQQLRSLLSNSRISL